MDITDLRLLIDYHYWARDRILEAVDALTPDQYARDLGSSFASVRDTMVHLYGAEYAWYERWHGTSPTVLAPVAQFPDQATLRAAWTDHESKVLQFLDGLGPDGIHRVFEYKSLDGRPGSQSFAKNIVHIVNHGSYHRGQVTTMVRQLGATAPKSMDLVAYYRLKG